MVVPLTVQLQNITQRPRYDNLWERYTSTVTYLVDESRFLQEVLVYHGSLDHSMSVEVDVNVLSKSTRVVVAIRLCISKGCEHQHKSSGSFEATDEGATV